MATSYGGRIAKRDKEIKKLSNDNAEYVTNIIDQYNALKQVSLNAINNENYKNDIEHLLDERNLYLRNLLDNKKKQYELIQYILEYLNRLTLEKHDTKISLKEMYDKSAQLEKQIKLLHKVI